MAGSDEAARELVVRVEEGRGRYRGQLVIVPPDGGKRKVRDVTDVNCGALIEALGFFIALSVDPSAASLAPSTSHAANATPSPYGVAPPTSSPSPSAPSPPPTSSAMRAQVTAEQGRSSVPGDASAPRTTERISPWHVGGGSGAVLASGLSPDVLFGVRAQIELSHEASNGFLVSPFLSVAGISTQTAMENTALGGIALRWQSLVGTVCPVAVPLSTFLALRACSALEVGRLRGEGATIRNAHRTHADWIAVGASGRLDVPIGARLFLELEIAGAAPLSRPRFSYSSGASAFVAPVFGGRASMTIALRL